MTPHAHQMPPMPEDAEESRRWDYTRRVRCMLYGAWQPILNNEIRRRVGQTRASAWGPGDTSHNLLRSVADTLASNYVTPPFVVHEDDRAERIVTQVAARSGLWPLMGRIERDLHGMREMLLRVDVSPTGRVLIRPVFPDMAVVEPDPYAPDKPMAIRELRWRSDAQGGEWCWDFLSIADPDRPVYQVMTTGRNPEDHTQRWLGVPAMVGDAYPYRTADGTPVLPYVLYHAAKTGRLWDAYCWSDLYAGTLSLGVMYTQLQHVIDSASWPQRVSVGLKPAGVTERDGGKRSAIVTDPATLLMLEPIDGFDGQPLLHQFDAGGDPAVIMAVIGDYERRLVSTAGVPASDVARVSGDPRSGYAIMLSRTGQREMQRRIQPQLEDGDTRTLRLVSILLNRWSERADNTAAYNLPEKGYGVIYGGVAPTPDEVAAERAHVLELLERGLILPVEAYQRFNPGASLEDALLALRTIAEQRRLLMAPTTPEPRQVEAAPGDTHAAD